MHDPRLVGRSADGDGFLCSDELQTACSPCDVAEISREIQAVWGAHLYVSVGARRSPAMDWYEVVLPEEYVSWTKDRLYAVLLHEWAHRMIAPVSPYRGAIWRQLARRQGLSFEQAQVVVNAAADAWVDRACLEHSRWGPRFRVGETESLATLGRVLSGSSVSATAGGLTRFARLWHAFNQRLLVWSASASSEDLDTFPVPAGAVLDDDERSLVDQIWSILYEGAQGPEQRISALAVLIGPLIPADAARALLSPCLSFGDYGGRVAEDVVRVARRSGLSQSEIEEIFGASELARLERENKRLALYAQAMPIVKRYLRHRPSLAFAGYRPWNVGRPLSELDVPATLQRGARLIPSVNMLSRRHEPRGRQRGLAGGAAVLVVDDSGSTEGSVLMREKEAAFAIIAAARAFGDPVGCVVFGSHVTTSLSPTTRYAQVEDEIAGLASSSGGTSLAPALEEALRMGASLDGLAILLMTDAQVDDPLKVGSIVRRLPTTVRLTAFCFGDTRAVRSTLGVSGGQRARVLVASARQPFAESALEEVYGG